MPLPALASISELARRALGDPQGIPSGTPEYVRAQAALEDASSLAREAGGDMTLWPTAAEAPQPVVRVVLNAARRWWSNPEGTTTESVSVGSVSESKLAQGVSVVLTEDEKRTCARAARASVAGRRAGAFSITPLTSTPPLRRGRYGDWGW